MLRALKRSSGKPVEKNLPRLCSPWQGLKLRCKHTGHNDGEERQPGAFRRAFYPATLHSQGLTPDGVPEFPEIYLCSHCTTPITMNGNKTTSTQSLARPRIFSSFSQRNNFMEISPPPRIVSTITPAAARFSGSVSPCPCSIMFLMPFTR